MKRVVFLILTAILLLSMGSTLSACDEQDTHKATPTPTVEATPTTEGVPPLESAGRLKVATTTSLYDTGLWGYLEPMFEEKYDVEVDVLYAGTGKALEWGTRGDVDVITVHSKSREEQFVADGYGEERVPFAYNYFLIVGPEDDPAGISGMSPEDAFATLMTVGAENPDVKFISRGDDSGTHGKEKAIWTSAGYDYEEVRTAGDWYIEAGSGMGPTLVMASEMLGYTLSDIGTFLSFQAELGLVPVVDEGDILLNVYSVLVVTSTKYPEMANNMVEFITSDEIQELIGDYGVEEYGRQLFTPCAGQDM
ncbi:MAG: substrate-binding domain-containing protein [Chloroflexota bacterium]|nr:substrate-binding domain-containing protein [Chloroflexota bacterium]